jgi:hypothetical protein
MIRNEDAYVVDKKLRSLTFASWVPAFLTLLQTVAFFSVDIYYMTTSSAGSFNGYILPIISLLDLASDE